MKKIFYTLLLVMIVGSINAENKNTDSKNTDSKKDICKITYTVTIRENGEVIGSMDFTIEATTCEEVEAAAVAAGIVKQKSLSAR